MNFFHESVSSSIDTVYVSPKYFNSKFKDYTENSFPVLHLNIRRCKSFKSFKELLNLLSLKSSRACSLETWQTDENVNENLLYQVDGYNLFHQNRKHRNGGGVAIFVKDSYSFLKR